MLSVGASMTLSLAGDLTLYTVLPVYATSLMIPFASLGILLSANRLVRFISNPFAGIAFDRWGRKPLFVGGLGLGAISTALYSYHGGITSFILGRLLWGISWSLIYIGAYCITLDITKEHERGWGSGILQVFYFIGLSLNPLIGSFLTSRFGFSTAKILCSINSTFGFLLAWFILPETKTNSVPSNRKALRMPWSLTRGQVGFFTFFQLKQHSDEIKANFIYLVSLFVGEGIILSTLTLYLKQIFGDKLFFSNMAIDIALLGGILLAIRYIVAAISAPIAGRISDRNQNHWKIIFAALLLGLAGFMLMACFPRPIWLTFGVLLTAASGSVIAALMPVIVNSLAFTGNAGVSIGILTTSGDIGSAIAPLAAYTLIGWVSLEKLYLFCAALLALGIILAAFNTPK